MRQRVLLSLFIGVAIVQLLVPGSMIYSREMTLRNGDQVRFRTTPVDPYDPFRGRFVALDLEAATAPIPEGVKLRRGQRVYAHLGVDEAGFAALTTLSLKRPERVSFIRVRVRSIRGQTAHLRLPFDRYYLEEPVAPEAERAYRRHSRRDTRDAYITVRVRDGQTVLEELYIAGKPLLEFLAQETQPSR